MPSRADRLIIDETGTCLNYIPGSGMQQFEMRICESTTDGLCSDIVVSFDLIIENELQVYKALSPNGDGLNDTWIINGIEKYRENSVSIYDRWGRLIFSTSSYDNERNVWDGSGSTRNGAELPNGTYFYRIEIMGIEEALKGSIELLR
jgi:gliding motility-associated-like protein